MLRRLRSICAAALLTSAALSFAGCASSPRSTAAADGELDELLLILADQKVYEPFTVTTALSQGPDVRARLADALGRSGDPKSAGPLIALLSDDDAGVRARSAFALGLLGEMRAVPELGVAAAGPDPTLGRAAVEALAKLDVPLEEVYRGLEPLPVEERWARLAPPLFRFDPEAVLRYAVKGFGVEDERVREHLVYGLARDPIVEGRPILRTFVEDDNPRIRAWAARALGLVGDREDVEPLLGLSGDVDGVAIQAMGALRRLVEGEHVGADAFPKGWIRAWEALVAREAPGARAAAIEAAGWFPPSESVDERLYELATTGSVRELELALVALGRRAPGEDRGPLAVDFNRLLGKAIDHPAQSVRAVTVGVATETGRAEWVEELAFDDAPGVRMAVHEFLLSAPPDEAAAAAAWILRDADDVVRAATLEWLTEQPRLPVEAVAKALDGFSVNTPSELPVALVGALSARAQAEPLERGLGVRLLESFLVSSRWVVRRAAAEALAELGVEPDRAVTAEQQRPANFYRAVSETTRRPRYVEIETNRGTLRLEIDCPAAPLTCASFLQLVRQGFYDGLVFHRVVPDFVVQTGDPRGDGWGGPGFDLRAEVTPISYERGVLGMADSGWDTAGSQIFLTLSPQPHLDGRYTAFGRVVAGDAILDGIEQGDSILSAREVEP